MKCKYCHKFAGIFSSKHKECEQKHIKSIKEIQDIVVEKLENSSLYDYCELKNELAEIAALGYVSDIEFENIIIISLKLFLTKKRIRINASNLKTFIYSLPENLKECITNEECYYEFWSNFFSIYFELGNYENLVEIQALMESIKVNDTISDKIDIALLCFLELRIHRFLSDGIIDYNEEQEIGNLIEYTQLSKSKFLHSSDGYHEFLQALVLRDIKEGKEVDRINVGHLPVLLGKKEQVLWIFKYVDGYEERTRRKYVSGSQGVSMQVCKGVYYRVGGNEGVCIENQYKIV